MTGTKPITERRFKRVVTPGWLADWSGAPRLVYVEIDYQFLRNQRWELSITGVHGPRANGNAYGDCGQNINDLRESTPAKAWTVEMRDRLVEIWEAWHLNGMRAGCVHQRAAGWDKRPIDPSKPTDTYGIHFEGQRHPSWNMLTWVRPDEHPGGLMTVPCEECGYKYGTSWLHEPVPGDVLTWLHDLPEAEKDHPWGDIDFEEEDE